jgi:hypothetical protein
MRRRHLITALIASAVLVAAAGCVQSTVGAGSDGRSMDTVAHELEPILRTTHGDSFAGLRVDEASNTLVIYRRPDADVDAYVQSFADGVRVDLRAAPLSLNQMLRVGEAIMADRDYWLGQQVDINGVAPVVDGSAVDVLVGGDTDAALAKLRPHYPETPLIAHQGEAEFLPGYNSSPKVIPMWGVAPGK